ncbi:MAG TPA: DUF2231 domain-containing protein [Nitrospiraceae bacterium]|nr:DUF2231 domain-containing protein [Nitrospiraceae bacterium]
MPYTTFTGHPLHPQMIVAPAGLLPFSLVLDLLYVQTGNRSYADAAYYAMIGGLVGGVAAGAAGAADYFAIPPDDEAKSIGRFHGLLNVSLLGLTSLNLLLRRGKRRSPRGMPLLLSLIGNAGLFVSAWYGGHLVYEHGMRVKAAGSRGPVPEIKPPQDEKAEAALLSLHHLP